MPASFGTVAVVQDLSISGIPIMAALARNVAQAVRCFIRDNSADRPNDVTGRLLQLSSSLGNMVLLFQMIDRVDGAHANLVRFVSCAQMHISQLQGACDLQDLSFLSLLDIDQLEEQRAIEDMRAVEKEGRAWSFDCALWICNVRSSTAQAAERVMESSLGSLSPVAEVLNNRALRLLANALAQIRPHMVTIQKRQVQMRS